MRFFSFFFIFFLLYIFFSFLFYLIFFLIVLANELVNNTLSYEWNDKIERYTQSEYVSELCGRIADANADILKAEKLDKEIKLDRHVVHAGKSVYDLLSIGVSDSFVAVDIFKAFLEIMNEQGRPPMLLALDDITSLSSQSQYQSHKTLKSIHAHDLDLPFTFIEYLSGKKNLV